MDRPVTTTRDEFEGVTTTTFTCMTGRSRAPRSVMPVQPRLRPLTGLRPIAELLAEDPPLPTVDAK